MTIQEAKTAMLKRGKNWRIPFMEFVDDLRRTRDQTLIEKPFPFSKEINRVEHADLQGPLVPHGP